MSGFQHIGSILDKIVADCALRAQMRERSLTDGEIEAVMAEVNGAPTKKHSRPVSPTLTPGDKAA